MKISPQAILQREVNYLGEDISRGALEVKIGAERSRQRRELETLEKLRARNAQIQESLSAEVEKLREITEYLHKERDRSEFSRSFRNFLAKLPWLGGQVLTRRSVEEILRDQYEISARRTKEAAEYIDRLEAAKVGLYDEIDRLNQKVIESAQNEELAGARVGELEELKTRVELELDAVEATGVQARQFQAFLDQTRRELSAHSTKFKLYSTAEDRLAKLQENTRQLAETIAHLQSDMTVYVTAASEKLDLVAGQIQAIGVAADASVVMLELQNSLKAMTESINHATRFVSETQVYFRQNIDSMLEDMELYDDETQQILTGNLSLNEGYDEMDVAGAMSIALADKIEHAAREAGLNAAQEEVVLDFEEAPAEEPQPARAAQDTNKTG